MIIIATSIKKVKFKENKLDNISSLLQSKLIIILFKFFDSVFLKWFFYFLNL